MKLVKFKRNLNEQEQKVEEYLAKDFTINEIAQILQISHHTVRSHVVSIGRFRKNDII